MGNLLKLALASLFLAWICPVLADRTTVHDADALRRELRRARPGTTIALAPGNYGHGVYIENLNGTEKKPIIITGGQDGDLPVFAGGREAIHLVGCNYVTLRNIKVAGCTANGINADDGGRYDSPCKGLVFDGITIEDIGPSGNRDGLKLSGLDGFVVRNCTISGWGGSAIDMVGCHDGIISNCRIIGKKGFSQASGIQAKGGSERIFVRQNVFRSAGQRAVNLGGSTGLRFFRPKLRDYEAKEIVVAGNLFFGSTAPIAYVTSVDCVVTHNTFVRPEKWVLRILQEQPTDRFKPCQGGVFKANLIVFDRRVQIFVNVGPHTKPKSFSFCENAWFCSDGNRRPKLPSQEINGIYQIDPLLESNGPLDLKVRSQHPSLRSVGAHAFGMEDTDSGLTRKNI